MKRLIDYINSAKINENQTPDSVDFSQLVGEIDNAWKYAGYKLSKETSLDGNVMKYSNESLIEYTIIFAKTTNGAKLGLNMVLVNNKDTVGVYCKFSWTNGKKSTSIYSNSNKTKRFELNFGKVSDHTLLSNWSGGHNYYVCTPEISSCLVEGIKELKYTRHKLEQAMSKSRFTDSAWNKLCVEIKSVFNVEAGRKINYSNYPWNT